jgi:hypothetical protein
MTRLLDRMATREGRFSRLADRLADRILPQQVEASAASCYWRCGGTACNSYQGWWGTKQFEYCSGGYYSGRSRCSYNC